MSPNIERLELDNIALHTTLDLSMYEKLTSLALRETMLFKLKIPPTIENLQWSGPYIRDHVVISEERDVPASNIGSLDLKGSNSISRLVELIQNGLSRTRLRRLAITSFVSLTRIGGTYLESNLEFLATVPGVEELTNVEHLTLRDDNIFDEVSPLVFSLFPNVKHLELESFSITEQIVTDHIKSKESVLETVVFRNCPKVSHDVEKWARARGVEVEHIRQSGIPSSFAAGSERRIRYE